jgi:hypothetical protein
VGKVPGVHHEAIPESVAGHFLSRYGSHIERASQPHRPATRCITEALKAQGWDTYALDLGEWAWQSDIAIDGNGFVVEKPALQRSLPQQHLSGTMT